MFHTLRWQLTTLLLEGCKLITDKLLAHYIRLLSGEYAFAEGQQRAHHGVFVNDGSSVECPRVKQLRLLDLGWVDCISDHALHDALRAAATAVPRHSALTIIDYYRNSYNSWDSRR